MKKTPTPMLTTEEIEKFAQDVSDDPRFVSMSDAAMLKLVEALPDTTSPNDAIAHYHRLMGARDYLQGLKTLGDKPTPPAPKAGQDNLNHKA